MVMVWGMSSVPAYAETIHVTIDQLIFSPVEIKAKVGDTIEWINNDIVAHTATVRDLLCGYVAFTLQSPLIHLNSRYKFVFGSILRIGTMMQSCAS
jgi:plastocyanin